MIASNSVPAQAVERKHPTGGQRGVLIPAGDIGLRLINAHEATALRTYPSLPQWALFADAEAGARLEVWIEAPGLRHLLFAGSGDGAQVRLAWPVPVPQRFDLRLVAKGPDVFVSVGPLFNPRLRLLPKLKGRGVEVGPGANPYVLPSAECDVSYVERMPMERWSETYAKGQLDASVAKHWDRYVVDSAHHLDSLPDDSLDFVFSSHVVEHLVNPLGVFRNWWRKLSPGGVIAGVVPDARHTFDLRQPLTTEAAFAALEADGRYDTTDAMYEKWCSHTAPYNSPESLKARDYSIHVNFFSVDSFRGFIDLFSVGTDPAGTFMESVPNGKDFGFLIAKR